MTKRSILIILALITAVAIGEAVLLWHLARQDNVAILEVRGTNAGVELSAKDARVFVYAKTDRAEPVVEGDLQEPLVLTPGQYDVRVAFTRSHDGQSRWLENVALDKGMRTSQEITFEAGEVSVDASVGQGGGQVVVYVFKPGDHDKVITSMAAGQPVLIVPGNYDLRIVLTENSEEKAIRWRKNVAVQTGLQTKVKVRFRQGALLLQARNGHQTLPTGAVELSIYRAGDLHRELLETGLAGISQRLAVGRYDIKATFTASNDKPVRWLKNLEIKEDQTQETTVQFSSGTVTMSAKLQDGEDLDGFQAYAYFYRAGDHTQPVAYAPAPTPVVLDAGRYDIRVNLFRSHDRPDLWFRDVIVPAGGQTSKTAVFPSGKLLVRVYDTTGRELMGDNIFVRLVALDVPRRPVAVGRSGEVLLVTAGAYELIAEDTRTSDGAVQRQTIDVKTGRLSEVLLKFEGQPDTR